MKKTYLDALMMYFYTYSFELGFYFVDNNGTIDWILSNIFLLGYVLPVEGVMIGIFFYLLLSHAIEHKTQLMFREKFKLVINLFHYTHTPLVVLRNQLEEIVVGNFLNLLLQSYSRLWKMPIRLLIAARVLFHLVKRIGKRFLVLLW